MGVTAPGQQAERMYRISEEHAGAYGMGLHYHKAIAPTGSSKA